MNCFQAQFIKITVATIWTFPFLTLSGCSQVRTHNDTSEKSEDAGDPIEPNEVLTADLDTSDYFEPHPEESDSYLTESKIPLEGTRVAYDQTIWPTTSQILSSPFGPRLKASDNFRYDFHRGVDIPGQRGIDPIYAIADGDIFRTYLESDQDNPYPNGGTVVVLRHQTDIPIPIHNQTFDRYYSVYMHLDSISCARAPLAGPYPAISKGAQVGLLGQSGTTTFSHLHFEIRVGTTCSLEYQLENPDSSCSKTFGSPKDPNINPFQLLPYQDSASLTIVVVATSPLRVQLTTDRNQLDFNQLALISGNQSRLVNLNDKTGIDPMNLDNNNWNHIQILPAQFSARSSLYQIVFDFYDLISYDSISGTDIWGNGVMIFP